MPPPTVQMYELPNQPEFQSPKDQRQGTVNFLLDYLAESAYQRQTPEDLTDRSISPSREKYTGRRTLPGAIAASRSVLSGQPLPPWRTSVRTAVEVKEDAVVEKVIDLHLFCEVGPYADLDWAHRKKIAAVASWSPQNITVNLHLHPVDLDLTRSQLRDALQPTKLVPGSKPDERIKELMDLYDQARKSKPPPITDLSLSDQILVGEIGQEIITRGNEIVQKAKAQNTAAVLAIISSNRDLLPEIGRVGITHLYNTKAGPINPAYFGIAAFSTYNPKDSYIEQIPIKPG